MNVMHVIDSLSTGGAERVLVDLVNNIDKDYFNVSICLTRSLSRSNLSMTKELRQFVPIDILNRRTRYDPIGFIKLAKIAKMRTIDIFHVHGRTSLSFMAFAKTLGLIKAPIVFHDHYGSIEIHEEIPLWFKYWAKNYVSHYVGVYVKLAEWAKRAGIRSEKISTIGNKLDLSKFDTDYDVNFRRSLGLSDDAILGVIVGRVCWDKGIDVLLQAITESTFGKNVHYLIIGSRRDADEYYRTCNDFCIQNKLSNIVLFLGERLDIPKILKSVDFAVLPSRTESGPLVLGEYMASGLPFISSIVGDLGHFVNGMGVPTFIEPGNSRALANSLDSLLSLSREQMRTRGGIGREVAYEYFDIKKTIDDWQNLYISVGSKKN